MKEIECNVQEPYKKFIIQGKKKIEGRLNKGKFKNLNIGDLLILPTGERFKVTKVKEFDTFRSMIEMGGIENIVPNATNIHEAENVYYQFYTKEQEKEHGVIGIYIEQYLI